MCIAVLNTAGKLSKKTIQNCWSANKDGAGIAHVENGKVHIFKEMRSVDKLYKYYDALRSRFEGNIMLHFRIATHGKIDEANCHPFKVNDSMAFIHNGIISQTSKANSNYSDTWHFNEDVVKRLPKGFLRNPAITELLSSYIDYSKLVFLDGDHAYIINEHMGIWDGANWFSNQSYKDRTFDSRPKQSVSKWYDDYDYGYIGSGKFGKKEKEKVCEICGSHDEVEYHPIVQTDLCINCVEEFEIYADDRI